MGSAHQRTRDSGQVLLGTGAGVSDAEALSGEWEARGVVVVVAEARADIAGVIEGALTS